MAQNSPGLQPHISNAHRRLLVAAAVFTVLLIAMGGILCVTHSIRSCPDWPGCFGKVFPPLETSPILEFTHRILAGTGGLLILASLVVGLVRTRRQLWTVVPPLVAGLLLVEVSFFGALVVVRGLAAGWAAVDVGSALLVVALMIYVASLANYYRPLPGSYKVPAFKSPLAWFSLATALVVYGVLVSGVLVAGPNSYTGCLGWPIYSSLVYQADVQGVGSFIRLIFSMIGILMLVALLLVVWRTSRQHPVTFKIARWTLAFFLVEALVQVLLLSVGFATPLLVIYTITAAGFWGFLVALGIHAWMEG